MNKSEEKKPMSTYPTIDPKQYTEDEIVLTREAAIQFLGGIVGALNSDKLIYQMEKEDKNQVIVDALALDAARKNKQLAGLCHPAIVGPITINVSVWRKYGITLLPAPLTLPTKRADTGTGTGRRTSPADYIA